MYHLMNLSTLKVDWTLNTLMQKTGDILDILASRDGRTVKSHFITHYSLHDWENVQTITVDMNASYTGFIPVLFPKAKIIIDRFHIVQLINHSMNKTRVNVMNRLNTSNGENQKKYRRLKRYWKKILKKESNLFLHQLLLLCYIWTTNRSYRYV